MLRRLLKSWLASPDTARSAALGPGVASTGRRLHIGGTLRAPGWEILNVLPGDHVDHVGRADELARFADDTFEVIYASHVLEHLAPGGELQAGLREWQRVLRPGGILLVSVPDLDVLASLFVDRERLNRDERFRVMLMMFGGHLDQHDQHQIGLNEEFLTYYLQQAGFANVRRVASLGQFPDTSELVFKGVRISLNVVAEKPAANRPAR